MSRMRNSQVQFCLAISVMIFGSGCSQGAFDRTGRNTRGVGVLTDYSATGAPPSVTLPTTTTGTANGYYTDPVFGTKIIRVTDNIDNGTPGTLNSNYAGSCSNLYSTWSAFNVDDSRILIECNNYPLIYNFNTSTDTPTFNSDLAGGQTNVFESSGATWSSTQPNIIYALGSPNNQTPIRILYKVDVSQTGAARFTVIHDFTNDLNSIYAPYDQNWQISELAKGDANDTKFAFSTRGAGATRETWSDEIFYDSSNGSITTWARPSGFEIHGANMDKGCNYVAIYAQNSSGTYYGQTAFWNINTNATDTISLQNPSDESGGHDDLGSTYYINDDGYNSGLLRRTYTSLHSPTNFFQIFTDNTRSTLNFCIPDHVSYRDDAGTYAVVSSYQQSYCSGGGCTSCSLSYGVPFANEVYMVKTDGTGFYRVAHTRSTTASCDDGIPECYDHQVRAAIDRIGHYIIFHSDMGSGGTGYLGKNDVFIVKIPSNLWPGGGGCTPPQVSCSGTCVDTTSDSNNCGACGVVCGANQHCSNSSCTCNSGLTMCSGQCVNLTSDANNCGSCSHVCPSGDTCVSSSCAAPRNVTGTDIDGDHKGDFVTRNSSGTFQVWKSNGTVEVAATSFASSYDDASGYNSAGELFAMDINGDGKTDLLARNDDGTFQVNLSDGTQWNWNNEFSTTLSTANGWTNDNQLFTADVNGDGKTDMLARQSDGTWEVWLSNGTALTSSGSFASYYTDVGQWGTGDHFYFVDVDGDGKTDFIARGGNGGWDVNMSNGSTYSQTLSFSTSYSDANGFSSGNHFFVADVNGDHKGDLLVRNANGTFDVWLSNGSNFAYNTSFTSYFTDTGGFGTGNRFMARDVNGDGKTDLIMRYANGAFEEWFSNGTVLYSAYTFSSSLTDANGWNSGIRFY